MFQFATEIYFDLKALGNKSIGDKSLTRLPQSPAIMASGISTIFSQGNPNEICDRLNLLLQRKQASNNSNKIIEEIIAIADKLLEYKCISMKQHKYLLVKLFN